MNVESSGAFLPYPTRGVSNADTGPLAGLTFAVKDLFDVAGYPTGAGHPLMVSRLGVRSATAPIVQDLLDAGARFAGKTVTDELAFSLSGRNPFYGTPRNGAAPDRLPGGSSSGSASAVAHGMCDFAMGTDTAGSVRLPASYQALWGLRMTHGMVPLAGCQRLAASLDAPGIFARDAVTLGKVAAVLLPALDRRSDPSQVKVAADAFALVPALGRLQRGVRVTLVPMGFEAVVEAARTLQAHEAWASYSWLSEPELEALSTPVRERLMAGRDISPARLASARDIRAALAEHLDSLLADGSSILLPTVDAPAPPLSATEAEVASARSQALRLLYPASLAGLPQVTMPASTVEALPLGLSLIGPRGSDAVLVGLAAQLPVELG